MNVKFANNTSKWQIECNSEFKGLNFISASLYTYEIVCDRKSEGAGDQIKKKLLQFVISEYYCLSSLALIKSLCITHAKILGPTHCSEYG
jgi:hypothetical protein